MTLDEKVVIHRVAWAQEYINAEELYSRLVASADAMAYGNASRITRWLRRTN